jgi:hypothetical protein
MGDAGMAGAPDECGVPGYGPSDNEASGSNCDEQTMETDLIDFEEERDEHLDETVLDGDSDDEPGSGDQTENDQDKSAEKDNGKKLGGGKKQPFLAEAQGKVGMSSHDSAAHGSAGLQSEKCHKEPPSAPAPRDTTAIVGGGGISITRLSITRSGLPGRELPTLPLWVVLVTMHGVPTCIRNGTWVS